MVEVTVGTVVDFATTLFVLSTMFAMGLELTIAQLFDALSQRRLMTRSLAVNLVVVPLLAYAFVLIVPMGTGHSIGILLIAMAPGAPFGPKLAEISRSDTAFASGLMAVLGIVSVATIPITVALLIPGDAAADPFGIAQLVVLVQLIPLLVGLGIDARYPDIADRVYPPVQRLSDYSFVFLILLLLVVYFEDMLLLVGTGTVFVSIAVVVGALVLGYALGGPARSTREVLATTTAARNAAIALFIATTSFDDPDVLIMVIAFSLVGVLIAVVIAGEWGRRSQE